MAETPKASIKDHEPLLPIIPVGIVAYAFFLDNLSRNVVNNVVTSENMESEYTTRVLGVVSYEFYEWCIYQHNSRIYKNFAFQTKAEYSYVSNDFTLKYSCEYT